MRRFSSLDQRILDFKIEDIFNSVADFQTYPEWWQKETNVKVISKTETKIGSQIEVSSLGGKFFCEVVKLVTNREIVVNYSGMFKGSGTWFFVEGANGVKVMYEIDLSIQNLFTAFVSFFVNFSLYHSKQMAKLYSNLEEYLKKKFKNETSDIDSSCNVQPPTFTLPRN